MIVGEKELHEVKSGEEKDTFQSTKDALFFRQQMSNDVFNQFVN